MKSIKPGRQPSKVSAIMGIFMAIFGVSWTILAISSGAPFIFPLFGICFCGIAIYMTVYHFKNASSKNRHSLYDIVDSEEEPDPYNEEVSGRTNYCPFCGKKLNENYRYCPECGSRIK